MLDAENFDYAKWDYKQMAHHARFVKYINSMPHKLTCQECGGGGGWTEPVLDDGTGPWEQCGWCQGTGYVRPWLRGRWLGWKRNA